MSSILWFDQVGKQDVGLVGGKNASLGEMVQHLEASGVKVPFGFAISAAAYRQFIAENKLQPQIDAHLRAFHAGRCQLDQAGLKIRQLIRNCEFGVELRQQILDAYHDLSRRVGVEQLAVAVRSSATAEDLPQASFAGQQESYLNVHGEQQLLLACLNCMASLYTDRAIIYREKQGFSHNKVALSVGVQQMVQSDAAGVMFTLDTETGFPRAVLINATLGLGETIVKGHVIPDRYTVFKPLLNQQGLIPITEKQVGSKLEKMIYSDRAEGATEIVATTAEEQGQLVLNDDEVLSLARMAVAIEQHYGRAMDIEWARDESGCLYIVQARPETIESQKDRSTLVQYKLLEKSEVLLEGASVGAAIATGRVVVVDHPGAKIDFPDGSILVTRRTDPDWVPLMRKAAGIITDSGGPTSHAAIVSRELKVPAIVGTHNATTILSNGDAVTISCAGGSTGRVYRGELRYETKSLPLDAVEKTSTAIMINAAMPDGAMRWWALPVAGIGLTRIEFMISSLIKVHPMALLHPERITDPAVAREIRALHRGYHNPADYFIENLALGLSQIASSRYPDPVIVRMSDFKSNEYRGLLGGEFFEEGEENPMLGMRGASRYYHPIYREGFQLECRAIRKAREEIGLDNIIVMIPFCRTPAEADKVLHAMDEAGLSRKDGLQIYVMCEIPSNVVLADQFAQRFDGFSIGSNDLTQLVLGIDRDSEALKLMFDARDDAVKRMIAQVIEVAHAHGRKVGICGQAPSDHPEFAEFLVECGIDSISLNPDSVIDGCHHVAAAEKRLGRSLKRSA